MEPVIMIKSYRLVHLWLLLSIFTLVAIAQSESPVIKNLAENADVILLGKVTQKVSSWNLSKTRIYTTTTVQVEEFLKGSNSQNNVEITSPGGEVGEVGELYTHLPMFDQDEEVLVFLKKDTQNNKYKVLNGADGKITVLEDAATKEKITSSKIPIKELKSQIHRYLSE
jgi:hypothetical protein